LKRPVRARLTVTAVLMETMAEAKVQVALV
jgi:hypothetical protein